MGIAYGPKKRMLTVIERYRKTGCITTEHVENLAQPPPYAAAVATTNRSVRNFEQLKWFQEQIMKLDDCQTKLLASTVLEKPTHKRTCCCQTETQRNNHFEIFLQTRNPKCIVLRDPDIYYEKFSYTTEQYQYDMSMSLWSMSMSRIAICYVIERLHVFEKRRNA